MANEYLKRTPTSTGNRKKWTWAGWVKLNKDFDSGDYNTVWSVAAGTSSDNSDRFHLYHISGKWQVTGTSSFSPIFTGPGGDEAFSRDPGAWMHICLSVDTTGSNLVKDKYQRFWVNGIEYNYDDLGNTADSADLAINRRDYEHYIGTRNSSAQRSYDGQMFDLYLVDGQALTPDVFGFYKDGKGYQSSGTPDATDFRPGQWSPHSPRKIKTEIERRGGFGVNGFYLPMNDSSNVGADFHTTPNSIITLKGEDLPQPRNGAPTTSDAYVSQLRSDPYASNIVLAIPGIAGGQGSGYGDYSADIKGSGSNKTVTAYGNAGISATASYYGSAMTFDGTTDYLQIPHSEDFNMGTGDFTLECWVNSIDDSDYQGIFGSYDYDNATVLLQIANNGTLRLVNPTALDRYGSSDLQTGQWNHIVMERYNGRLYGYVNGVVEINVSYTSSIDWGHSNNDVTIGVVDRTDYPGQYEYKGQIQDIRLYKGIAKYKGGFDVVRPYTPVGIEKWRTVSDTCKNNFATSNPNLGIGRQDQLSYAEGNLKVVSSATGGSDTTAASNMAIKGKIYCEFSLPDEAIGCYVGIMKYNTPLTNNGIDTTNNDNCWIMRGDNGNKANGEGVSGVSYGGAFSDGDIIMMAVDIDNGSIWWGRNGSWNASGNPSSNSNAAYTNLPSDEDLLTICGDNYSTKTPTIIANYGQNPTFGNRFAINKNRVNSSTADSVWHQSSNTGTHTDWTVSSGGTELDVAVPSGHYARVKLRSADGTIDPKKTYLLSFKYTTGPSNLGVQNDQGYMTAVDGSASPNGLSSGNFYSFVFHGTSEIIIVGFTGSTYALDNVIVSEIDECYTDDSGKGKFHYQPPTGYLALCEDNLPTPTIADPGKHFKCVTYTGDSGAHRSISGVGFQPDLVWVKCRSHSKWHALVDSVRGNTKTLFSNDTSTQVTETHVPSFDDNGFSVADIDSGTANENGMDYVAWCWKAGGQAVSNSDGSITTQVSANQDAGFSIVKWTSNGNTSVTSMGHGLGKTPKFMIHKRLGVADNWFVYHSDIQTNNRQYLRLNTPDAAITSPNDFWSTSSSTMGIRQSSIAANGQDCIAYCWAEVEGFSKIGSYFGNGTADGPFVYCGFKPAWIMIKPYASPSDSCYSGGYTSWSIYDSSRSPVNDTTMHERVLFANRAYEEGKRGNGASSGDFQNLDLLSNGFKLRGNSNCEVNTTSINGFIFAAFAESPFQTANAK